MNTNLKINVLPDKEGFFGSYGGQFLDEDLKKEFQKIADEFLKIKDDKEFNDELNYLLKHYVGRPSPVYYAKNLSEKYGADIYLKREDLNHTGAHKINNALGQALLAKKMGVNDIKSYFAEYYASHNFVKVEEEMPAYIPANMLSGNDGMRIFVGGNDERILLVSVFDNLGKGASGAAVQCMNIALGLDERTSLSL